MKVVGCDFRPSYQQVAVFDNLTGEVEEKKLMHGNGEGEKFYRELEAPALIGMESTGDCRWFKQLLERLGHKLVIGDAAQIRASYVVLPLRFAPVGMRKGRAVCTLPLDNRNGETEGPSTALCSGRDEKREEWFVPGHSLNRVTRPQVPPLRYAPVGMTKGRVVCTLPLDNRNGETEGPPLRFAPVGMRKGKSGLYLVIS